MPRPTVKRPHPVTNYERELLMDCFLEIADKSAKQIVEDQMTRSRGSRSVRTSRKMSQNEVNDAAIPIKLPITKRAGVTHELSENIFKRPRLPEVGRGRSFIKIEKSSFASSRNLSVAESFASSRPPSIFENEDENYQDQLTLTQETIPDDNLPNKSDYGSTRDGGFDHPVDTAVLGFEDNINFTSVIEPLEQNETISANPAESALRESFGGIFRKFASQFSYNPYLPVFKLYAEPQAFWRLHSTFSTK